MVSNRKARVLVWRALVERNILRLLKERGKVPYNLEGLRLIKENIELEFMPMPHPVTVNIIFEDPKDGE